MAMQGSGGAGGAGHVPTWRDGARPLSRDEKAALTTDQLKQYHDDSVLRDLSEIDLMPEPLRNWTRHVVATAQARVEAQLAYEERSRAS